MGLLDYVVGGDRIASRPARPQYAGGEWDSWWHKPARTRRRLVGAGYAHPRGLAPDQLAEVIASRLGGTVDHRDAVDWYVRHALLALEERRRLVRWERERRLLWQESQPTYYAYRTAWCRDHGYPSVWAYRKALGWT